LLDLLCCGFFVVLLLLFGFFVGFPFFVGFGVLLLGFFVGCSGFGVLGSFVGDEVKALGRRVGIADGDTETAALEGLAVGKIVGIDVEFGSVTTLNDESTPGLITA
jgi:hypothetical protein